MTFLMSCMGGESPHCHCHSHASPRGRAHRTAQRACGSGGRGAGAATCFSGRGHRHSSQKQSSLSFYTVCGLEMNVKMYLGIYLSVPVRLLLPEPYADLGQGQCCAEPARWQQRAALPSRDWCAGKRLRPLREAIMSEEGVRPA